MFSGDLLQRRDSGRTAIRSLAWATDIDVLPLDAIITRNDGFWVVRSPSNPTHYWGNFLLFDDPPRAGDGARWEARFAAVFGDRVPDHRSFGWDRTDGSAGAVEPEFVARGYALERTVGLLARPGELVHHPRANREVSVRALDPIADAEAWSQVIELWVAGREPSFDELDYREFASARLADLRALFQAGRGAWWVAELEPGRWPGASGSLSPAHGRATRRSTPPRSIAAAGSARGSWSRPRTRPPRGIRSSAS